MVLYHVTTAYQLMNCIEHGVIVHKEEEKIIIIADFLARKYPQYKELRYFFSEIINFPYSDIVEDDTIEDQIQMICKKLLKCNLNEFDYIYCAGIQMWFPLYLLKNNYNIIAFEEASGGYTRPHILIHNDERISKIRYEIMQENNIYNYSNKFIKNVICNKNVQVNICDDEKVIDFNPVKMFQKMESAYKEKLMDFFRCPKCIDVKDNSVLILTQQLANLGVVTFEEQIIMYQVFVDYFFEDKNLIIKTHPDDQVYYQFLFPEAQVIDDKFPSEFLPYIFSSRPEEIATIYSTGIFNISSMFKGKFELDMRFEESYIDIHKYYACCWLMNYFNVNDIETFNVDRILLRHMSETTRNNENSMREECEHYKGMVYKTDNENNSIEKILKENHVIIFLDSKIFSQDIIKQINSMGEIVPIQIEIHRYAENYVFINSSKEIFYIYFQDKQMKEVSNIKMKKRLKSSGVDVLIKPLDKKDYEKIMLKAQLEATEERLKYYIKENKELREKCR